MNEALQLDYLFVGARIRERLAAQVPELATEGAIQDVENFGDQAVQRAISDATVFLAWEGDQFETGEQGRAGGGRSQAMRQQWTALVVVRNAAQQQDGNARNVTVGPLLSAIHKALAGWSPEGAIRPLLRVQGRKAQYTPNVGLYPLTFEVSLTL